MFFVNLRCDAPKAVFLQDMNPYFECHVIGFIINLHYYPLSSFSFFLFLLFYFIFYFFINVLHLNFFECEQTIKPVLK